VKFKKREKDTANLVAILTQGIQVASILLVKAERLWFLSFLRFGTACACVGAERNENWGE